jgi:hypothetical protein
MSFGASRAVVLAANFEVHGLPVTVTPPGGDPVETRGIWMTPITEDGPAASEFSRREARHTIALLRSEVPSAPRGTTILGNPVYGAVPSTWRVDGVERSEAEHVRVTVVPVPE